MKAEQSYNCCQTWWSQLLLISNIWHYAEVVIQFLGYCTFEEKRKEFLISINLDLYRPRLEYWIIVRYVSKCSTVTASFEVRFIMIHSTLKSYLLWWVFLFDFLFLHLAVSFSPFSLFLSTPPAPAPISLIFHLISYFQLFSLTLYFRFSFLSSLLIVFLFSCNLSLSFSFQFIFHFSSIVFFSEVPMV